jgi:hypothetical protein
MRLPGRLGGLGVTSMLAISDAAFLGSVAASLHDVLQRTALEIKSAVESGQAQPGPPAAAAGDGRAQRSAARAGDSGGDAGGGAAGGGEEGEEDEPMELEEIEQLLGCSWAHLRDSVPMLKAAAACRAKLLPLLPPPATAGAPSSQQELPQELPTLDDMAKAVKPKLQRGMTNLVHHASRRAIMARHEQTLQQQGFDSAPGRAAAKVLARMHSSLGPGGSAAWLRASACTTVTQLLPLQFQTAVYLTLGRDHPMAVAAGPTCGGCKRAADMANRDPNSSRIQPSDPKGYHLLQCKHGNEICMRHDMLRDRLEIILKSAGWRVLREPTLSKVGVTGDVGKLRMDLAVLPPDTGTWELIDVSVVSPVADTYSCRVLDEPLYAIKMAEERKQSTYTQAVQQGFKLTPFIGTVFGRWNLGASDLLKRAASAAADRGGVSEDYRVQSRIIDRWWQELACVLVKGNTLAIASRSAGDSGGPQRHGGRRLEYLREAELPEFR